MKEEEDTADDRSNLREVEIAKARAEVRKLEAESDKLSAEARAMPSRWFVLAKYVVAGAVLAVVGLGYYEDVVKRNLEAQKVELRWRDARINELQQEVKSSANKVATSVKRSNAALSEERSATGDDPGRVEEIEVRQEELLSIQDDLDMVIHQIENVDQMRDLPGNGWIYVGEYRNDQWLTGPNLSGISGRPVVGESYDVKVSVNVRTSAPSRPWYRLAQSIGVYPPGTRVSVIQVRPDVGRKKVWAEVQIDQ